MSTPILPFAVWQSGTNQNSIPANDNSLRTELMERPWLGVENSPPTSDDGDVYVVGDTPAGAFATFSEYDVAIYRSGNWTALAPFEGMRGVVNGVRKVFDGAAWINDPSVAGGGSASWGAITGTLSAQTDLQAALDGKAQDRRTVTAAASTSGVLAIDCSLGDYFTHALDENVTSWSFSNLPGSGKGITLMIRFVQDSTARTVAWPASFKWAGGSAGAVSTASGAVDVLAITTFDNGSTWDATLAKAFA